MFSTKNYLLCLTSNETTACVELLGVQDDSFLRSWSIRQKSALYEEIMKLICSLTLGKKGTTGCTNENIKSVMTLYDIYKIKWTLLNNNNQDSSFFKLLIEIRILYLLLQDSTCNWVIFLFVNYKLMTLQTLLASGFKMSMTHYN